MWYRWAFIICWLVLIGLFAEFLQNNQDFVFSFNESKEAQAIVIVAVLMLIFKHWQKIDEWIKK